MTHIRVERVGSVGVISIDRPERFNSLDVTTAQDLRRAGLQCARDEQIRAVVLRGPPRRLLQRRRPEVHPRRRRRAGARLPGRWCACAPATATRSSKSSSTSTARFRKSAARPKPFIAAVDGVAAAGGFGLAMCCDLVIASSRATFEWAYGKTALTGAESATFLLPRLIGLRRCMELVLLNPRLTAAQALDYGLITAVHDPAVFEDAVMALAHTIAEGPRHAFAVAKELLNQSAGFDRLDGHLDRELQELSRAADGAEVREGIAAFFDKRAPDFSGPRANADCGGESADAPLAQRQQARAVRPEGLHYFERLDRELRAES